MISPIVVCCLRILNCFFRSRLPQENPPSERRKKSWWAVHKHHGCYVNTHVNMYINPCHPMCTHQAATRASIKGGTCSRARRSPHLRCVSPLCSWLWFLLQLLLLMSLPASDRPWWSGPGRCTGLQGGATAWLPLAVWDWLFPERPQKSKKKWRNVRSIYGPHPAALYTVQGLLFPVFQERGSVLFININENDCRW